MQALFAEQDPGEQKRTRNALKNQRRNSEGDGPIALTWVEIKSLIPAASLGDRLPAAQSTRTT
jgi:hypothetical protein